MFLKKSILLFFVLVLLCNTIYAKDAVIKITSAQTQPGRITPLLFGNFIEFLNDFVNGDNGMWAQELTNRGFDKITESIQGIAWCWNKYGLNSDLDSIQLIEGGYNPNGKYFQRIVKKSDKGKVGVFQKVYVYDTVGGKFYVYLRGEAINGRVKLMINDTLTDNTLFTQEISSITSEWTKFEVTTPKIAGTHKVKLLIALEGTGTLDIDEASFMPLNNVDGMKSEYYQMFADWKPGILRYPGGYFADTKQSHWEFGIGEMDKRVSPNNVYSNDYQRMDFGTDEFLQFCEKIGSEAHIVVNLADGTAEEAANWIEYCNGSVSTKYGAIRAQNGHSEPYHVKYCEIGNEQWYDPTVMATKYLPYYDAIKKVDSSVQIMVCGNVWDGIDFFNKVFDVIGTKCDFYSYHNVLPGTPYTTNYSEIQRYYSMVAGSIAHYNEYKGYCGWLNSRNLYPKVKLAITEYFISYNIQSGWIDTSIMNSTLETGSVHGKHYTRTDEKMPKLNPFSRRLLGSIIFVVVLTAKAKELFILPRFILHYHLSATIVVSLFCLLM